MHYADVVSIMGATIVINWLFNHVRGSVLLIMILHAANNAISGNFFSPMFTGADSARQAWLLAAIWCVLAVVVVLVGGPRDLSRKPAASGRADREDDTGRSFVGASLLLDDRMTTAPV